MRTLHRITRGVRALFTRSEDEAELREELRAFYQASVADKLAKGMSGAQAERAARLELGSAPAIEDWVRDAGWESRLESVWQDVRYAVRTLVRNPRFAALAILTFALGIGVTLAIFTLADGMLFRPLPFADPARLVMIQTYAPRTGQAYNRVLGVDFDGLRSAHSGIDGIATASAVAPFTMLSADGPVALTSTVATPNLLELLGVPPHLGRRLGPGDETGTPQPVMLSHAAWHRHFGGDPAVIGRTLRFEEGPVQVVGVLPTTFFPPIQGWRVSGDVFSVRARASTGASPTAGVMSPVARLRPGVSTEAAQAEADVVVRQAMQQHPKTDQGRAVRVAPLQYALFEPNRSVLWILVAAAAGVLLITSINLANLLLARGAAREKEIGIRSAIGGSRARIIRQLTIESLALGLLSAIVALVIASTTFGALSQYVPARDHLVDPQVGARTIGVALLLGIGTSLIFGLAPAARLASRDAHLALRETRRMAGRTWHILRAGGVLVTAEVALCLIMLTGTGLMVNSLVRQRTVDLGFDPDGIRSTTVRTPEGVQGPAAFDLHLQALAELRKVPRMAAAGIDILQVGRMAPMTGIREGVLEGAGVWSVTDDYFATLGIPLIVGREFTADEVARAHPVTVISESVARRLWPTGGAVGRTLEAERLPPLRVVGVARDVRNGYGGPVQVSIYRPIEREGFRTLTLVMRSADEKAAAATLARTIVQRLEPRAMVGEARPLTEMLDAGIVDARFQTGLFGLFGLVGLAVAAIGVYSVMAQVVVQRTFEFGVRHALGASSCQLMAVVLREASVPLVAGVVLGLAGAYLLSSQLQALLYGIRPQDPLTFIAVSLVLLAAGLVAAWIPARRAARVDPLIALRAQ
jgi:putative ABC transport system permease protein